MNVLVDWMTDFLYLPNSFIYLTEKAMVVSLSSLMNDSVPDKVEVTKLNLPADILLLLDLAHGPESDAVQNLWVKLQTYAKKKGTYFLSYTLSVLLVVRKLNCLSGNE